ncbi:type II toxin-antitoxin system PemK/MazF family toxin [Streptomyces sp. NPDC127084]|uniref:type II toxin-antitoxin system PemK/MazF family toxin n=1 Tax=Streptomyces sp. NPDC127084 TaxID=3347133 RepID=UPI003657EBF0
MDTSWWLALGAVVVIALSAGAARIRPGSRRRPPGGTGGPAGPGRTARPGGPGRPGRPGRQGKAGAPGRRPAPAGPGTGAGAEAQRMPQPGEIWWADVPYEDGPGSKDRPCLVLRVRGGAVRVAKITSKYHDARPGVIPLPPGAVGDAQGRPSFLETDEVRDVRVRDFRRRVGVMDPLLWDQVRRMSA